MNNDKLLESYNNDGYYIAKSVLDQKLIEKILSSINVLFQQQLSHINCEFEKNNDISSLHKNMKYLFNKDINRYTKTLKSLYRVYSINEIFFSNEIKSLLKNLKINLPIIPTSPVVHIMSNDLQIPGGYNGLSDHQDFPSMQGSLDSVIVWIPLVNIDKNLYPLEIVPKSNHLGLLPGKMVGDHCYEIDNDDFYKEEDFIPVEVEVGDVVLMSSFTIHRSGLNGPNNDIRIAFSLRFDNSKEPSFIERSYPTVYKRSVDRVFLEENFPTQEQVKNIFRND